MKNFISRSVANFAAKVALMLVAFGLVGCDEVKSIFSSIEEPIVQVESGFNSNLRRYDKLVIQSQDNEMIIESITLNRGNCPVALYEITEESFTGYVKANPERAFVVEYRGIEPHLKNKDSDELYRYENLPKCNVWHDGLSCYGFPFYIMSDDIDAYNKMDTASQQAFVSLYPVKLPYGEKFSPVINCNASKIIEVELKTNGGTFTFNLGN